MSDQEQNRPTYTKDDFLSSLAPYEWLYRLSGFQHEQALAKLRDEAKAQGVGPQQFNRLYKKYRESISLVTAKPLLDTDLFESEIGYPLTTGDWVVDGEEGIFRHTMGGKEIACRHLIAPVMRLINAETKTEKMQIVFKKLKHWQKITVDKATLAHPSRIIELSNDGVSVTSENARALIKYLQDVDDLSRDVIPTKPAVSRLGWSEDYKFAPYEEDYEYDGERAFEKTYQAVKQQAGSPDEWIKTARVIRQESLAARIVMAASFASALVKICDISPFMVHIWGATSTGKTITLRLAASIWGNPDGYMRSFNATEVGEERLAAFFNSLPLILDESQALNKDGRGASFSPYQLSLGQGRLRGHKQGGIDPTGTWQNCIITSGEAPLIDDSAGGGAHNRALEIKVTENSPAIKPEACSPVYHITAANYGHAGRLFIQSLDTEQQLQKVRGLYQQCRAEMAKTNTTDKQALFAALIMAADAWANEYVFFDEAIMGLPPLTAQQVFGFLKTKAQVSDGERARAYLRDWITENARGFYMEEREIGMAPARDPSDYGSFYGIIDSKEIFILPTTLKDAMKAGGYNYRLFLDWLRDNNMLRHDEGSFTVKKKTKQLNSRVHAINRATFEAD